MVVYDSLNVNVNVNGRLVTGFGEDTMISCSRNEDRMIPYSGVKGDYAASINNNKSGTIQITLSMSSPMNAYLQDLAVNKQFFPVSIYDVNDETAMRAGGNDCMIQTEPANERGGELVDRTWTIFVFDYTCIDG